MRLGFLEQKDIAELISNEVRDLIFFWPKKREGEPPLNAKALGENTFSNTIKM